MTWTQIELKIIRFMTLVTPWTSTTVVATLTYYHAKDLLMFTWQLALLCAIAVEIIGVTSAFRLARFQEHNRRYKDPKKKMDMKKAYFLYAFYLLIAVNVNIMLEVASGERNWVGITAIALLSLLNIPGSMGASEDAQLDEKQERISEANRKAAETRKRNAEAKRKLTETERKVSEHLPVSKDVEKQWKKAVKEVVPEMVSVPKAPVLPVLSTENLREDDLTPDMKAAMIGKSTKQLRRMFPAVSERTLRNWRNKLPIPVNSETFR